MQTWKFHLKKKIKIRLYKLFVYLVLFAFLIPSLNFSMATPSEKPDLNIKNVNVPSTAIEGNEILVNVTIKNRGGDITEGIKVEVGLFIDEGYKAVSVNSTDEVFSKFASQSIKNIPFIDKIMTSLTDGLINAALVTRVALIAENYCSKTYVSEYRELYP